MVQPTPRFETLALNRVTFGARDSDVSFALFSLILKAILLQNVN